MADNYSPTPLHVVVADNVRILCARQHVAQAHLADVLHLSRMAVSDRFSYRTPWKLDEVQQLAGVFGVPVSVLVGEAILPMPGHDGPPVPLLGVQQRHGPMFGQLVPGLAHVS